MNNLRVVLTLLVLGPALCTSGYLLLTDLRKPTFGAKAERRDGLRIHSKALLAQQFRKLSTIPIFITFALVAFGNSNLLAAFFAVISLFTWKYENETSTRKIKQSKLEMARELPGVAEVFSILVSGGESFPAALSRIAFRASGSFADALKNMVTQLQSGQGLIKALDHLAVECGIPEIRRFCDSMIIAIERGTPLSDVLSRQIFEIRARQHSRMIAAAGKAEVALLFPVVFLILPISVIFALWPSYLSLNLNIAG